jgi:hypothetical protein
MALTKDFRETIRDWAQREPAFRKALLREAIQLMLSEDERTGRAILRNYKRHLSLLPRRITSHRNRRYLARRPPNLLTKRWGGSRTDLRADPPVRHRR